MEQESLEDAIRRENIKSYDYNEFSFPKKIGKGGFATVYISEWKDRPSKGSYNIILQFAKDGDLRTYLKENFSNLEWTDKFKMAYEISNGLAYLHKKKIIHRDLHSKNILVHEKRMLIADFGLSKDETSITSNSSIGGVAAYIDPKCFEGSKYKRGKKSDIFSFGVILWEISSGKPPFQSFNQEYIQVQRYLGKREEPIEGTPELYIQLYERCWDRDPNKRPKLDDVSEKLKDLWTGEVFESILRIISLKLMFIKFINSIKVLKDHVYWNYDQNQCQSLEEFSKKLEGLQDLFKQVHFKFIAKYRGWRVSF
ncbi:kinase-like protein [Gigaspora margarita]|uniref:Kinase-like protein n=1 Tax=Gigaspora margarita TaxID=4874 RepID=A0A8H4A2E1_GIGMA|nr:kinase-like protein [Gigaspora margarita]